MDETKRANLMEAALDEFAERGIESASYNRIIERSGLSKGTVYYYFDNKDSLLLTVMDEICEMFRLAIGELELPDTKDEYWAAAREYNRRSIQFFFENPRIWRILLWISKDSPYMEEQLGVLHDKAHEKALRFMDDLIAKGRKIGAVRNDIPLNTAQSLMHSLGKILSADLLGKCDPDGFRFVTQDGNEKLKIEKFISAMHDLSRRILTPEEDLVCFTRF